MENRKPFKLRSVLIIYNFFQVCFSLWLFYEASMAGWLTGYSYRCEAVDTTTSPRALRVSLASDPMLSPMELMSDHLLRWPPAAGGTSSANSRNFLTHFSSSWESGTTRSPPFTLSITASCLSAVGQVTASYILETAIFFSTVWWGVKFTPGGHSSFFGFVNTGVHIVMYTYYMLAAMGPSVQKYLWWKKYLTVMQMVQFIAVMAHAFQLLFHNPCQYPIAFVWWIGLHAFMFFFLFKNFFDQAYRKVRLKRNLMTFSKWVNWWFAFFSSAKKDAKRKDLPTRNWRKRRPSPTAPLMASKTASRLRSTNRWASLKTVMSSETEFSLDPKIRS